MLTYTVLSCHNSSGRQHLQIKPKFLPKISCCYFHFPLCLLNCFSFYNSLPSSNQLTKIPLEKVKMNSSSYDQYIQCQSTDKYGFSHTVPMSKCAAHWRINETTYRHTDLESFTSIWCVNFVELACKLLAAKPIYQNPILGEQCLKPSLIYLR